MHVALRTGTSNAVVSVLIGAWPDALMERDDDGKIPLHTALQTNAAPEAVQVGLIAVYPLAGVKELSRVVADGHGNKTGGDTALHIALQGGCTEAALALIDAWPGGIEAKNQ